MQAEWNMDPVNKKILLDGSFKHAGSCCSRGTELMFTWTKEGTLEVRLENELVETFLSNDLAQDLFLNFVNEDPVSPHAKVAFVNRYPELLEKQGHLDEETSPPSVSSPPRKFRLPRYRMREEPEHVKQHKWQRRVFTVLMMAYFILMLFSLPGSKRRFQERLRRGGGSWRGGLLRFGSALWRGYMRRLGQPYPSYTN